MNSIILERIKQDLTLLVQPIYSAKTNEIAMYEVLSRISIDGKQESPDVFLRDVDIYKHKHLAMSVLDKIDTLVPFLPRDTRLTININLEDLLDQRVMDGIIEKKENIVVEIIENSSSFKDRISLLRALKDENVSLALDDFGSNFSMLNFWVDVIEQHRLFDIIKLDGLLVETATGTDEQRYILKTLIALMKTLNQEVVAEYIKDEKINNAIKGFGVDYVQGYFYSKPFASTMLHKNQNYKSLSKIKVS